MCGEHACVDKLFCFDHTLLTTCIFLFGILFASLTDGGGGVIDLERWALLYPNDATEILKW